MITIDNRQGSRELYQLFPQGLAALSTLQFGDLSFLGRGPDGEPVSVGIERKRIKDLANGLTTGRLSGHQLPGLINSYNVVYLVIEGIWIPNPQSGVLDMLEGREWLPLTLGARTFMAKEIYNYLNSLIIFGGVIPWMTDSPRETVMLTTSLYHWWNDKSFYQHTSYKKAYQPFANLKIMGRPPSLLFKIASQLPGVGEERAVEINKYFPSVAEMVNAGEEEWREVPGIGKTLSRRIPVLLKGEGKGNQ